MAYGLIGLYGLYLVFVGYKGNANALMQQVTTDGPGFVPWLIVVIALGTAYRSDTLRPVVKPFIALAVLGFVLKNFTQLKSQLEAVINFTQTPSTAANPAGSSVSQTGTNAATAGASDATLTQNAINNMYPLTNTFLSGE